MFLFKLNSFVANDNIFLYSSYSLLKQIMKKNGKKKKKKKIKLKKKKFLLKKFNYKNKKKIIYKKFL